MEMALLELRFQRVMAKFRQLRARRRLRPFGIEFYGTPKSGKTTMLNAVEHYLKRLDWNITVRPEGAEVIDLVSRSGPHYNFRTWRYAMGELVDRLESEFEIVGLDRGLMDGVVWLDYWERKGKMLPESRRIVEASYLIPENRDLFDLHICLVCDPQVAIERELAHALLKKDGDTMNPKSLQALYDAHRDLWQRLKGDDDPRMSWHDSSKESMRETAVFILDRVATAFERRIETLR